MASFRNWVVLFRVLATCPNARKTSGIDGDKACTPNSLGHCSDSRSAHLDDRPRSPRIRNPRALRSPVVLLHHLCRAEHPPF
ncbi:hypothetical protein BV25DRAFT_1044321 [Artomyces pyxidatus]|uniref:Uncharacterized protein n=1 Tax=Artomyces pyxidatus TaxID=48021 RepID=A0ACB8SV68_9AGAM|nr:hypothetical protein BV25DRAFT_1044321 [Artomyces pyxidatus]